MRMRSLGLACVVVLAIVSGAAAEILQVVVSGGQETALTQRIVEKLQIQFAQVPDFELALPARAKAVGKPNGQPAKPADMVMQLEVVGTKSELVGCTIQEPTGALLFDSALDEGSADAIAAQLAEFVRVAREKRSAAWKGKRVQVLGVWAEEGSTAQTAMLDTLANVVASLLVSSPDVIVLPNPKRRPAAQNDDAQQRPVDPTVMSLLLKFSGETAAALTETVVLLDSKRQSVAEFSLKVDQLDAALIQKTSETTLQKLDAKPGRKPAAKERMAYRYIQLAEHAWSHQQPVESLGWSETALMFNPHDAVCRRRLIDHLLHEAVSVTRPYLVQRREVEVPWTRAEAQMLAARALDLQVFDARSLKEDDWDGLQAYFKFPELLHRLPSLNEQLKQGDQPLDVLKRQELIGTECVVRPLEMYLALARKRPQAASGYSLAVAHQSSALLQIAGQEPEFADPVEKLILKWLDFFDELPAGQKPWSAVNPVLRDVTSGNSRENRADQFEKLLDRLRKHPHALLKLLAQRRDITSGWTFREPPSEEKAEKLRPYRKAAIELLESAVKAKDRSLTAATIQALSETYHGAFQGSGIAEERLVLGEEMLRVGAVSPRIIFDGTGKLEPEQAPRAHKLLTQLIAFAKANGSSVYETSAAPAIRQAKEIQIRLEREFANVPQTAETRRFDTLTLITVPAEEGPSYVMPVGVRGDQVYCWLVTQWGSAAQLLSVSLKDGERKSLGGFEGQRQGSLYGVVNMPLAASGFHENHCYFGWPTGGIGQLSLNLNTVAQLSVSESLPKGAIKSLASLGEHIYVGSDSGWLVRFKPSEEKSELLASSSREPAETPLDNTVSFSITNLMADAPRKRLLFITRRPENSRQLAELWEFNVESTKFRRLAKLGHQQRQRTYAAVQGDTLVLADTWIVAWNLKRDTAEVWSNYAVGDLPMNHRLWLPQATTPVFCRGSVWWVHGNGLLGELTPQTGDTQNHILDAGSNKPFDSSDESYLRPVDDNRFLMYHGGVLSRITPGERTEPPRAAK